MAINLSNDHLPSGPADYLGFNQQITFNVGDEFSPICVDIPINDDALCEGPENFFLSLTAIDICADIIFGDGTVTIIDNDGK